MKHGQERLLKESAIRILENKLFFHRWIKTPKQLGTLAPISGKLATLAAQAIEYTPGQPLIEIGAGTGRLTRALLAHGVQPKDLTVIELDEEMCAFLGKTLPQEVKIIHGDALKLKTLIASEHIGHVKTVVSSIPFMYLPPNLRFQIAEAAFSVMPENGKLVHVTYNPRSPLIDQDSLSGHRHGALWINLPPGFVWTYYKKNQKKRAPHD